VIPTAYANAPVPATATPRMTRKPAPGPKPSAAAQAFAEPDGHTHNGGRAEDAAPARAALLVPDRAARPPDQQHNRVGHATARNRSARSGVARTAYRLTGTWRQIGGSGAATTTSDCHGARLASSRDDEPSADFVLLGLSLVTGRGAQRSSGYARAGLPGRAARSCLPPSGCGRRYVLMTSARKSPGLSRARGGCLRKRVVVWCLTTHGTRSSAPDRSHGAGGCGTSAACGGN